MTTNKNWHYEKSLLIDPNNIKYSGSGFIVLEYDDDKPTILLAKTKHKNKYMCEDFGGQVSTIIKPSNSTLFLNAIKEIFEESQCVFDFTNNKNLIYKDIDSNITSSYYRCHFIMINKLLPNIKLFYENNKKIINNLTNKSEWHETYSIERFYIEDLLNEILKNKNKIIYCNNINGIKYRIRSRTINCLKQLFNDNNLIKHIVANRVETLLVTSNDNIKTLIINK